MPHFDKPPLVQEHGRFEVGDSVMYDGKRWSIEAFINGSAIIKSEVIEGPTEEIMTVPLAKLELENPAGDSTIELDHALVSGYNVGDIAAVYFKGKLEEGWTVKAVGDGFIKLEKGGVSPDGTKVTKVLKATPEQLYKWNKPK